MLVADFTFFDFFWSMVVFFLWVMWFWLLFTVWTDIFRRDDLSGGGKALWLIFTIVLLPRRVRLPDRGERRDDEAEPRASRKERHQFDEYVRETAGSGGGAAAEIEREGLAGQRRDHAGGVQRPEANALA